MGALVPFYTENTRASGTSTWGIKNPTDAGNYETYINLFENKLFITVPFPPDGSCQFVVADSEEALFHRYMKNARANSGLLDLAKAIQILCIQSHITADIANQLKSIFKELAAEANLGSANNQIVLKHCVAVARQLANSRGSLTDEQVNTFENNLRRDLYPKKPLSPRMKMLIGGLIGALIGLVAGIAVGAAVTAYVGGVGAVPGALIGMTKGFTLGTATAIGATGFGLFGGGIFGAVSGAKNYQAYRGKSITAKSNQHALHTNELLENLRPTR